MSRSMNVFSTIIIVLAALVAVGILVAIVLAVLVAVLLKKSKANEAEIKNKETKE